MREVIPFMELMKEVSFIFDIHHPKPEFFCKVFKYNQSCIAVAESEKLSPGKKSLLSIIISRAFTQKKIIWICYIDTRE